MDEHEHQAALMDWVELQSRVYSDLELIHAIPNGGWRNIATAKKLKREGVRAGVPDLFLPCPRGQVSRPLYRVKN